MPICGMAVKQGGRPASASVIHEMTQSLLLRAVDSCSHFVVPQFALGCAGSPDATSISSAGTVIAVCDADLYNREDLARSLPDDVRPGNDADLLAALYVQGGRDFLSQLRGVFAVAIWDTRSRSLLLARDRFGVKWLSYTAGAEEIVFASQMRGIFASGRIPRSVNSHAIVEYVNFGIIPAPETAFQGVWKVNPGEFVLWQDGQTSSGKYWDLQYSEDAREGESQLARQLLGRMEDAVRVTSADLDPQHTGCFLSGGTDSSSVVGLLTGIKGQPANTFSIGFAEQRFNELEYAHLAASHFKSNHTDTILGPAQTFDIIPKVIEAYDEPFANASAIPTYWCAHMAQEQGIEVLLAGDGGDELFGGNERYRTDQVFARYHRIPRLARRWLLEPVIFASPFSGGVIGKAQRYIRRANQPNPERYCQWRTLNVYLPRELLGQDMPLNGDTIASVRRYYDGAPARSELNRLLYVDIKMTLGDDDLPKVVRTTELAGVRVRFPYLDHPLADFSGRLPAALKVRGLEKRYLFKMATRNLLPEAIRKKKKHGFGLPIGYWLKTDPRLREFSRDVLLDAKTYQRGYFRRAFIEKVMQEMESDTTPYHGDVLWSFLALELWHRRHVEGIRQEATTACT